MDINEQMVCARGGGGLGGGGPQKINDNARGSGTTPGLGMPTLNSSLAPYCSVFDGGNGVDNLFRIVFGRRNPQNMSAVRYPSLAITDDGSTGYGSMQLCTFPKGTVAISAVYPSIRGVISGSWSVTSPVMSIGSAAAATGNATLTGTEADIVASTAFTIGSGTVAGTASTRVATFSDATKSIYTISGLTDNSGGTSGAGTIATVTVAGTIPAGISVQNAVATLAAQVSSIQTQISGLRSLRYDGSTTALSIYLNFAVNSDPSSGATISIGALADDFNDVPSYLDIYYRWLSGVNPPKHGEGGG